MKKLPPEMNSWYFKFNWDNKKIWNLNIPTISKHMSELEWHFDIPIWSDTKGKMLFNLKPRDVIGAFKSLMHN